MYHHLISTLPENQNNNGNIEMLEKLLGVKIHNYQEI